MLVVQLHEATVAAAPRLQGCRMRYTRRPSAFFTEKERLIVIQVPALGTDPARSHHTRRRTASFLRVLRMCAMLVLISISNSYQHREGERGNLDVSIERNISLIELVKDIYQTNIDLIVIEILGTFVSTPIAVSVRTVPLKISVQALKGRPHELISTPEDKRLLGSNSPCIKHAPGQILRHSLFWSSDLW
jgi:hypothetical protein